MCKLRGPAKEFEGCPVEGSDPLSKVSHELGAAPLGGRGVVGLKEQVLKAVSVKGGSPCFRVDPATEMKPVTAPQGLSCCEVAMTKAQSFCGGCEGT